MTRASDTARLLGAGGTLNGALSVDTISEKTSGSGVTIDSLNVKDGGIGGHQIGGRRNIIINGAMQVAQRGTSETGIGASAGYFTLDRFRIQPTSTAGRLTMEQVADVHDGFANALKLTCTTADTSIAAGERLLLHQKIEGQDLQQLKKGTSDAEEFTVSFYVKGNANATYALEIYDLDNNRQISKTFSVTTSWNRVILTFPADTTGAYDDDSAASIQMSIFLHAGSTYTSGTLNSSAFASNNNANRAVGISSFFDSTDRTFFLTGLQMEVGSQATPFEHRSFGEEQALCQRYFCLFADNNELIGGGGYQSSTFPDVAVQFPVPMRTGPTLVQTSGSNYYGVVTHNALPETFNDFTVAYTSSNVNQLLYPNQNVSGTQGSYGRFQCQGSGKISFSAEL